MFFFCRLFGPKPWVLVAPCCKSFPFDVLSSPIPSYRWTLDYDDYTGLFCNRGEFPFTRRVHEIMFDSILTTSTLAMTNDSPNISTTTIIASRPSKSSPSSVLNRTNKTNYFLLVAPSHRTKTVLDSRMVNHAGDHYFPSPFDLLFIITVFHLIK